jgi:hypothetical protein
MKGRTYIYQTGEMAEAVEKERTFVPIETRWGE